MNNLKNYILQNNYSLYVRFTFNKLWKSSSSSSSSSSDSDDPKPKLTNQEKIDKLNELLTKLVENDKGAVKSDLKLSQPTNKRLKTEKVEKHESDEVKLIKAAKDVAKKVEGDAKEIESELLSKLLHPPKADGAPVKNLMDIVKGMKIDRETKSVEQSRADQVRNILQRVQTRDEETLRTTRPVRKLRLPSPKLENIQRIDLFGAEPLGVFSNKTEFKTVVETKTWNSLYERDLKLAVTHPPSNYFQQMILWTEQGKVWKFPIDNEQGLEEESKVTFDKHIFLEQHLESWCPQKGPIRHFMELVCVGLSKNPYLTVEAKKEHIEWYRKYFEEKQTLLEEVGAIPVDKNNAPKPKIEG